jgi:hypothetical protein
MLIPAAASPPPPPCRPATETQSTSTAAIKIAIIKSAAASPPLTRAGCTSGMDTGVRVDRREIGELSLACHACKCVRAALGPSSSAVRESIRQHRATHHGRTSRPIDTASGLPCYATCISKQSGRHWIFTTLEKRPRNKA